MPVGHRQLLSRVISGMIEATQPPGCTCTPQRTLPVVVHIPGGNHQLYLCGRYVVLRILGFQLSCCPAHLPDSRQERCKQVIESGSLLFCLALPTGEEITNNDPGIHQLQSVLLLDSILLVNHLNIC